MGSKDVKVLKQNLRNDDQILSILKEWRMPLCLQAISILSGIDKVRASKVLKSLRKRGLVRPYTRITNTFYGLSGDADE